MIKNLKYRLMCVKKSKTQIIVAFLSIILVFEIYSCYSLRYLKEKEDNEIVENLDEQSKLKLEDIVNDLILNNFDILGIEKDGDDYNIEINIKGRREDILNSLKSLKSYTIIDYNFNASFDNIEGKLRLRYN